MFEHSEFRSEQWVDYFLCLTLQQVHLIFLFLFDMDIDLAKGGPG